MAFYLDFVSRNTGCLRVIPGSHVAPMHDRLRPLSRQREDPETSPFDVGPEEVPCFSLASRPGDVVFFNQDLWHATFGGRDRRRFGWEKVQMNLQSASEIAFEKPEHPYLFLTASELARIRKLVRREGTYQAARFAETRKAAEAWLEDPVPQPDRGGGISRSFSCPDDGNYLVYDRKEPRAHRCPKCGKEYGGEEYDGWWRRLAHHEVAFASRDLALTYAITGDGKFAREAARILIDNATLYPTLPALNLSRLGIEALDEVRLLIAFASAYDLVATSGFLSSEERRRIENGYFRNAAELIRVGQGSFVVDGSIGSNFQATIDAGVGIAGLLLRDPGLTAFAITGPVGFNRLMEIGVLENGMWWESSIQ